MSSSEKERVAVNTRVIAQELAGLQQQINQLQQLINELNARLASVKSARQAIAKMKNKPNSTLVAVDAEGNVLMQAKLEGAPIVHLGLNIYAEMTLEEAEKMLSERERAIAINIGRLSKELEERVREYSRLREAYYAILQRAAAATGGKAG